MSCLQKLENIRIISPEELILEEAKSRKLEEWSKVTKFEYPYSSREFYKAINNILKCDEVIYFKDLEDITGIEKDDFVEDKKIGTYYSTSRFVPQRKYTYKTICGEETETEPAYIETEHRFHRYTRSEMANKYFNLENNNDELKIYLSKLSDIDRKKIKAMLVELTYELFLSVFGVPSSYYAYPIHGNIDWQAANNYSEEYPVGMRNIFAKIVNDNELNFSQSIILAILLPEFITNYNYSKLQLSDDKKFICCNTFIKTDKRNNFPNESKKSYDHTLVVNQDLIDKIKYIFDEDYIFKLAPMETYALKSKFDILFKKDWFKKYPSISKQNLLDLIFYTEDEKQLIKYLEFIKDKSVEIQEKLINFIAPLSSYVSIKDEYNEDEIYNVINYINTLKFYKGSYINFDPEICIKDYRKDYRKTFTKKSYTNFDEYLSYEKKFSVAEMESMRLHLNDEIATPCKIQDKEFNIKIKSGIWMMHTLFVDKFETFFREKESLLTEILNSNDCKKYLDKLLSIKDIILKHAYINSNITIEQYHDYDKLRSLQTSEYEKAQEKVVTIKSIIDDEINLILEQINREKNNLSNYNNKSSHYSDVINNDKKTVKIKIKKKIEKTSVLC